MPTSRLSESLLLNAVRYAKSINTPLRNESQNSGSRASVVVPTELEAISLNPSHRHELDLCRMILAVALVAWWLLGYNRGEELFVIKFQFAFVFGCSIAAIFRFQDDS